LRLAEPQEHSHFLSGSASARLIKAVRRQRRAATSSDELQPAARGGGELRGSASRKSSAKCPANSRAQSTAQPTAACSAQRGGKTGYGFPA